MPIRALPTGIYAKSDAGTVTPERGGVFAYLQLGLMPWKHKIRVQIAKTEACSNRIVVAQSCKILIGLCISWLEAGTCFVFSVSLSFSPNHNVIVRDRD